MEQLRCSQVRTESAKHNHKVRDFAEQGTIINKKPSQSLNPDWSKYPFAETSKVLKTFEVWQKILRKAGKCLIKMPEVLLLKKRIEK
jgi:hypothetical protein